MLKDDTISVHNLVLILFKEIINLKDLLRLYIGFYRFRVYSSI